MQVYHRHLRALGYCNRGLRRWFAEQGIPWHVVLEHGVDADWLRSTNNAMARAAADFAAAEAETEAQQPTPTRTRRSCS